MPRIATLQGSQVTKYRWLRRAQILAEARAYGQAGASARAMAQAAHGHGHDGRHPSIAPGAAGVALGADGLRQRKLPPGGAAAPQPRLQRQVTAGGLSTAGTVGGGGGGGGSKPGRSRPGVTSLLQSRDLRAVDPAFEMSNEPAFLVRKHCILINLPPVRAIVMADKCLFFQGHGADGELVPILQRLTQHVKRQIEVGAGAGGGAGGAGAVDADWHPSASPSHAGDAADGTAAGGSGGAAGGAGAGGHGSDASGPGSGHGGNSGGGGSGNSGEDDLPFEFFVLETVMVAVCALLTQRYERLRPQVNTLVDRLTHRRSGSVRLFDTLRTTKKALADFIATIKSVHRVVAEVLDTPADLSSMALSALLEEENRRLGLPPHAHHHGSGNGAGEDRGEGKAARGGRAGAEAAALPLLPSAGAPAPLATAGGTGALLAAPSVGSEAPVESQPPLPLHLSHGLFPTAVPVASPTPTPHVSAAGAGLSGQATPAALPSLPPPPPQAVEGIPLEDYSDAAEVLLEAYLAEVESILTKSKLLRDELEAAENQLNLVLASNRNQLLRVEISITTFTAAMTACTVVASYLGMNLNNGWNTPELTESSYAVFVAICIGCSAGAIALSLLFCLYMRRRGILQ
jgi:hypothetical protein